MIYLTYRFNQVNYKICDDVVQWDTGQVMKISNLPHYCTYSITYSNNGKSVITDSKLIKDCLVHFPDECFFESGTIHAYIQRERDGETETIADISIFVKERKLPQNISPDDILAGKLAVTEKGVIQGKMPNNGTFSKSIDKISDIIEIPVGYHDGNGSVAIAYEEKEKLIPDNIRKDITILGVEGAYESQKYETYDGKYNVTPKTQEQTLETENKLMEKNIKIEKIPYYEVSNPEGGTTFIIAENN